MFLVNAAQHPGPALFQGIGLIVVSIWAVWYTSSPTTPDEKEEQPKQVVRKTKRKFWEYANDPGTRHNEDMKEEKTKC